MTMRSVSPSQASRRGPGEDVREAAGTVLAIVHQAHSTTGRVGELLEERGYRLDCRCPNLGHPLPECLEGYAATIVFGGPMSANHDHLLGIRAELGWLERIALPAERPLLGICLGAQLMARALGARVGPHPDGLVEIGYHEVRPTADGRACFERPAMFYQWHSETFEIPEGAVHLAENRAFPAQAFRYDASAYGIEFHPEMTREMIERWTASKDGAAELSLPGAQSREMQLEAFERHGAASDAWLARFLDRHLLAVGDGG
jgi:GMP synthase (glutamine-hydrolysing)